MEGGSSSAPYDPTNAARVLDVQPLRTVTLIQPGPSGCSAPDASNSSHAQPQTMMAADETPKSSTLNRSRDSASAVAATADTLLQAGVSSASDVAASGKKERTDLPVRRKKTVRKSVALGQPESFVSSSFDFNDTSDKKNRKERMPSDGSDNKRRRQRTPNKKALIISGFGEEHA